MAQRHKKPTVTEPWSSGPDEKPTKRRQGKKTEPWSSGPDEKLTTRRQGRTSKWLNASSEDDVVTPSPTLMKDKRDSSHRHPTGRQDAVSGAVGFAPSKDNAEPRARQISRNVSGSIVSEVISAEITSLMHSDRQDSPPTSAKRSSIPSNNAEPRAQQISKTPSGSVVPDTLSADVTSLLHGLRQDMPPKSAKRSSISGSNAEPRVQQISRTSSGPAVPEVVPADIASSLDGRRQAMPPRSAIPPLIPGNTAEPRVQQISRNPSGPAVLGVVPADTASSLDRHRQVMPPKSAIPPLTSGVDEEPRAPHILRTSRGPAVLEVGSARETISADTASLPHGLPQNMPPNISMPPSMSDKIESGIDAPAVVADPCGENAPMEDHADRGSTPQKEHAHALEERHDYLLDSRSPEEQANHALLSDFEAYAAAYYRSQRIEGVASPVQDRAMQEARLTQAGFGRGPLPRPAAPDPPDLSRQTLIGYEKLARMLAAAPGSIRPAYRKFEVLHHRILLHVQDELCELEEHLRRLDEVVAQTGSFREPGVNHPPSRRAEAYHGSEVHARRTHLLGQIFLKLEQYRKFDLICDRLTRLARMLGIEILETETVTY